ncbi:hypothetical protein Mgra_00002836 [Meloidogyne graminicola]|uniref:Uncharacterized protein n=1 Tax=Meloidogyne graminicola TaxID=189291 RepID=A0A8S9ZWR9_9BILA|nr:hypothetical protein Mgra_00002836 [Meloidogyne graminicola]
MKTGLSKLYELQPDPYDNTQTKFLRICLFTNVENASELRELVRKGEIDASLIRAELLLEPFVLLAAANRAIHQSAHNRMITRSLSAELIYSLSPNRNISDSLNTFGIAENSHSLVVAIFDDVKGKKMISIAKRIKGMPVSFETLRQISDLALIKQEELIIILGQFTVFARKSFLIYQLPEPDINGVSMSDLIVSRIVTKEIGVDSVPHSLLFF